jgi:hypothetical protein
MTTLHLSLKGEYFDAIRDGTKPKEYRLCTPYWTKRLVGREYSRIVLTKGYPAREFRKSFELPGAARWTRWNFGSQRPQRQRKSCHEGAAMTWRLRKSW